MKKILMLAMVLGLLVSGCMASFPKTYSPKFSMNPEVGATKTITATTKFENSFWKRKQRRFFKTSSVSR